MFLLVGTSNQPLSPVNLTKAESETNCTFRLTPPDATGEGTLRVVFLSDAGRRRSLLSVTSRFRIRTSNRKHSSHPWKRDSLGAKIENKAAHVVTSRERATPSLRGLREIGSDVKILGDDDVKAPNLAPLDAVVLGVRAYNVHSDRIGAWYPELLAYAQQGGVVVVQYNTTPGRSLTNCRTPFVFRTDRVTDENAEVRILAPDHPV
jgi:hypothetical protein